MTASCNVWLHVRLAEPGGQRNRWLRIGRGSATPGLDALAGARYSTTEVSAVLDHREFVGRVGKALWRPTVSRPTRAGPVGTSPGLDTLAGARYSTTEYRAVLDHREFVGRVGKALWRL